VRERRCVRGFGGERLLLVAVEDLEVRLDPGTAAQASQ
jgi:hypothetical protein